ncbi:fibronectin type III domain-containing protein [Parapedobacter tibetensis]|uniref:fibronectin type III domain-containing protein n=1 Tax=Parapedobacter tibetensis TaxID=2972951 RepID=UPI00214DEBBF|nr:fibronectin type III domain-containing protein [Parapedobacter tibetensis]
MRTPKLITHYGYMSDPELANMATRTADALRTSMDFPDLDPPFAEYEPYALDYVAKQAITVNGRASGQQKKEKDEAREALLKMMRRVASYINNGTDVSSIQLGSGFLPVSEPRSSQVPRTSAWARLADSNRPGEILLQFEAIREAYQYEMQLAFELDESGQPVWQDLEPAPRAVGNFYSPVVDGVTYHFRVRSRNKKGVSEWSPVDSLRARVKR